MAKASPEVPCPTMRRSWLSWRDAPRVDAHATGRDVRPLPDGSRAAIRSRISRTGLGSVAGTANSTYAPPMAARETPSSPRVPPGNSARPGTGASRRHGSPSKDRTGVQRDQVHAQLRVPPAEGVACLGTSGQPQCGQADAAEETSRLQSGQRSSAMMPPPGSDRSRTYRTSLPPSACCFSRSYAAVISRNLATDSSRMCGGRFCAASTSGWYFRHNSR